LPCRRPDLRSEPDATLMRLPRPCSPMAT
jgi:hypothetical protein